MVLPTQGEETSLADVKRFSHVNYCDQTLGVRLKQEPDLLIREASVNLTHCSVLLDAEATEHRCSLFD